MASGSRGGGLLGHGRDGSLGPRRRERAPGHHARRPRPAAVRRHRPGAGFGAGNRIARLPYRYGGGHGRWEDSGYDCSGSVSYALHGAGLLRESAPATGFYRYGQPGPGRWITLYANGSHMYMVVAGLRFDTSGRSQTGSRWQVSQRSPGGFVVRHPTGL